MLFAGTHSAWATTYTVNDAGDAPLSGAMCGGGVNICTLRAAIERANQDATPDIIAFAIGSGPVIISPATPLPEIVQPLTINGYTQPGSKPNMQVVGNDAVVNVRIDGKQDVAGAANGLVFSIGSSGSVVRGVAVTRFWRHGVAISGVGNVTVAGNFIGTDGSGSAEDANGGLGNVWSGVAFIQGARYNTLGGTAAADRNIVVGISAGGSIFSALTFGESNNTARNNYIGTDRTGTVKVATSLGITFFNAGANQVLDNVIGSSGFGIYLFGDSPNNIIRGNFIGLGADGAANIAGGTDGILITDGFQSTSPQNTLIGGSGVGEGNTIAHWGGWGVRMALEDTSQPVPPQLNAIQGNSIYRNGLGGIHLENGSNHDQPFPSFNGSPVNSGGSTNVPFKLQGQPGTQYMVEFFSNTECHNSGFGEGQQWVGRLTVMTDASGSHASTFTRNPVVPQGRFLTMTATRADGDTSQFSACSAPVVQANGGGGSGAGPVMAGIPDVTLPTGAYQELMLANMATPADASHPITGYQLTGSLPPGMVFNSVSGLISGTPTTPGTYTLMATATDKDATSNASSFKIIVQAGNGGGGNPGNTGGPGGNAAAVPALGPGGLGLMSLLVVGVGGLRRRSAREEAWNAPAGTHQGLGLALHLVDEARQLRHVAIHVQLPRGDQPHGEVAGPRLMRLALGVGDAPAQLPGNALRKGQPCATMGSI